MLQTRAALRRRSASISPRTARRSHPAFRRRSVAPRRSQPAHCQAVRLRRRAGCPPHATMPHPMSSRLGADDRGDACAEPAATPGLGHLAEAAGVDTAGRRPPAQRVHRRPSSSPAGVSALSCKLRDVACGWRRGRAGCCLLAPRRVSAAGPPRSAPSHDARRSARPARSRRCAAHSSARSACSHRPYGHAPFASRRWRV